MVNTVARLLAVGTVAVSPPTVPAGTAAPLSPSSVAMSPLPRPARVFRTVNPTVGAVHDRAAACLSDHTDTTQLPAGAVAVGVLCAVPPTSSLDTSAATGSVVDVPEYAASCSVTFDEPLSAMATSDPASPAVATLDQTWVSM